MVQGAILFSQSEVFTPRFLSRWHVDTRNSIVIFFSGKNWTRRYTALTSEKNLIPQEHFPWFPRSARREKWESCSLQFKDKGSIPRPRDFLRNRVKRIRRCSHWKCFFRLLSNLFRGGSRNLETQYRPHKQLNHATTDSGLSTRGTIRPRFAARANKRQSYADDENGWTSGSFKAPQGEHSTPTGTYWCFPPSEFQRRSREDGCQGRLIPRNVYVFPSPASRSYSHVG